MFQPDIEHRDTLFRVEEVVEVVVFPDDTGKDVVRAPGCVFNL